MAKKIICEWCSESFKTQGGLDWHTEAHLREAGLLLSLDAEWQGVPIFISEKPGKYLLVLPAVTRLGDQDPDTLESTMQKDLVRAKEVTDIINKVNEELPPVSG